MESQQNNAIADATLVATLKGRIRRAPTGRKDAARRAILDLAVQACYGVHVLDLAEGVAPDGGTTLALRTGLVERGAATARSDGAVNRQRCETIVDGRVVKLTPDAATALGLLLAARGSQSPGCDRTNPAARMRRVSPT